MSFWKWFKDLVLPFENPDHPLYSSGEDEDIDEELDQMINDCLETGKPMTFYKDTEGNCYYKTKEH